MANLKIPLILPTKVEAHNSLALVVFNLGVRLEAQENSDHLLVIIGHGEGKSCPASQISKVGPRVRLQQHPHHQRVVALSCPDKATLMHLIELEN